MKTKQSCHEYMIPSTVKYIKRDFIKTVKTLRSKTLRQVELILCASQRCGRDCKDYKTHKLNNEIGWVEMFVKRFRCTSNQNINIDEQKYKQPRHYRQESIPSRPIRHWRLEAMWPTWASLPLPWAINHKSIGISCRQASYNWAATETNQATKNVVSAIYLKRCLQTV